MESFSDTETFSEEYPTIVQPRFLDIQLYEHQKTTVYRMIEMEKHKKAKHYGSTIDTRFAIIGDEPGYGKTLSVCTLIALGKMQPTEEELSSAFRNSTRVQYGPLVSIEYGVQDSIRDIFMDATLVVCSTSILAQWEKTLKLAKGRIRIIKILAKKDITTFAEISRDFATRKEVVVLCTDKMYNNLARLMDGFVWKRFVFDEPASVHIANMQPWKACFSWFITATYHMFYERYNFVQRSKKSYLKEILRYLDRDIIDALVIKNPIEYIISSQDLPHPIEIVHRCFENAVGGAVQGFVSNEVQEMIAAGNIAGAITSLGGDPTEKNVYEAARYKLQKRLVKAKGKLVEYKKYENSEDDYLKSLFEKWNDVRAETKEKIRNLEERMQEALESSCPICCTELSEPVLAPCCQHIFCGGCIFPWLTRNGTASSSCPTCRAELVASELIVLSKEPRKKCKITHEKGKEKKEEDRVLTKIEHIEELVKDKERRILIFSSHESSFEGVERLLNDLGIKFGMIKGHKSVRERVIAEFMEGALRIVLVNAKFNASGIDLQSATDVILLHDMKDYIRRQAIGRAQRLGRVGAVKVHSFLE
ncbi:putative helicase [Brazilian marseillevirus]|uniref:putative helicase n=1 Tax=Brazilian marseillevirus TaxID=1813599 RepID=UPI0007859E1F|nr:putative helicase [Brazilian marseillevirus]AMQ10963.1 putative helicase [Brazilian marseillevirus]